MKLFCPMGCGQLATRALRCACGWRPDNHHQMTDRARDGAWKKPKWATKTTPHKEVRLNG